MEFRKVGSVFFMKKTISLFYPNCTFSPSNFPKAQWFTLSNFQPDKTCILKHLERAMILDSNSFHFQRISSDFPFISIVPSTTLSDHSSILFAIAFSKAPTHNLPFPFYLNTSFLQSFAMKAHICRI